MVFLLLEQWGRGGEHPGKRGGVFATIEAAREHVADTQVHHPTEMDFYIFVTWLGEGGCRLVETYFNGEWHPVGVEVDKVYVPGYEQ